MASIVKRGNSFSVVYYTRESGVRKQKWEAYRSEQEALRRKEIVEYPQSLQNNRDSERVETVEQLAWEYVRLYGKLNWSLSMYASSCALIRNYIVPYFGCVRLNDLSPRLVSKLYMDFLGVPKHSDPYHQTGGTKVSPCTLISVHKLLHSMFEQAVLWEYVPRNPFHKAALLACRVPAAQFLSPEQIRLLLDRCRVPWLALMIELAFACTLRKGEILALTWENIDWQRNTLRVNKTLCRVSCHALQELDNKDVIYTFPTEKEKQTVMVLKTPKTQSSIRVVYVPPTLRNDLLQWKSIQQKSTHGALPRLIFTYEDGRPLQSGTVTKYFKDLLADCGLPKVTFHSLRHSSITYKLVLTGGNIKAVQGDSGHSQAEIITELYGHVLDKNRQNIAYQFEQQFYQNGGTP